MFHSSSLLGRSGHKNCWRHGLSGGSGAGLNLYSPFMSSVTLSKSMQIDSVVGKLKSKNKQQNKTRNNLFLVVIE